jgi:hypothetical protein
VCVCVCVCECVRACVRASFIFSTVACCVYLYYFFKNGAYYRHKHTDTTRQDVDDLDTLQTRLDKMHTTRQ